MIRIRMGSIVEQVSVVELNPDDLESISSRSSDSQTMS